MIVLLVKSDIGEERRWPEIVSVCMRLLNPLIYPRYTVTTSLEAPCACLPPPLSFPQPQTLSLCHTVSPCTALPAWRHGGGASTCSALYNHSVLLLQAMIG